MSKEGVQAVINKAVTDGEFRKALFADPDGALAGFDLTDQETASLRAVDAESMESLAGSLDERISKAYFMGIYGAGSVADKPLAKPGVLRAEGW